MRFDRPITARLAAHGGRTLVSMSEPSDTHPEAARVQLELLRKAGTRGRLALTLRLSNAMITASRRAIRKRHPELSEEEVRLLWAELHYGKELADRVRAHLAKRAR